MPTDAFEIADSQDTEYNGEVTGARIRSARFVSNSAVAIIDAMRTALLAAGWTEGTATKATTTITLQYGLPIASGAELPGENPPSTSRPIMYFNDASNESGRVNIVFFNPMNRSAGVAADTEYIPSGGTVEDSVSELVDTINDDTDWAVTDWGQNSSGRWFIDIEAKTAGSAANSTSAGGVGRVNTGISFYASASQPDGGGWVLRSTAASGEWLEVWMYVDGLRPAFEFRSSQGGATPTFHLAPAVQLLPGLPAPTWKYTVIACQFQFAIFADQGQNHFLFASMPYLQGGCEYGVLIVSNNNARNSLRWRGTNGRWASARDGELTSVMSSNYAGCYPGFFLLRQIGMPILTTQGFPITESAYIGLPTGRATSPAGHSRVVGKIWDALILSKTAALGDKFAHRGLLWQCIFSQTGFGTVRASVWIAYADAPA